MESTERRAPKETGSGPTTVELFCPNCWNEWTAAAHWEGGTRIVLDDDAHYRCGTCGTEGRNA